MKDKLARFINNFHDSKFLQPFHGWSTIIWGILVPISVLTPLKSSLPWIVLMSAWANFVGHWSAWGAFRAENASKENNNG